MRIVSIKDTIEDIGLNELTQGENIKSDKEMAKNQAFSK